MSSVQANVERKIVLYWGKVLITIFFMFGFSYLPAWEPLGQLGMQIMGIFIGLLFAWTFIGFVWPSFLAILALGLTEYMTVAEVLKNGFGDATTLFILLILIFTGYLEASGLSTKMAYWFLSRKSAVGHPWRFTFLIFLAAFVLCIAIHLYATIFLLWSIFYKVCDLVGYRKGDKYPACVVAGIVVACVCGYAALPIKAVPLMIMGSLSTVSGGLYEVDFGVYALMGLVSQFAMMMVYFLMVKYIIRPDVSRLMNIKAEDFAQYRESPWTVEQKVAISAVAGFILLLFAPSILPKTSALGQILANFGMNGAIILVMLLLIVLRLKGKPIMDFTKAANSGSISWDIVIMFAATMPVAKAMSDPVVGVQDFIIYYLTPIFEGMGPLAFSIAIFIIAALLTQVTHNVVLGVVLTPIMYHFSIKTGANPVMMAIFLSFALNTAFATPAASAPSAIMYLNVEWIGMKRCYGLMMLYVCLEILVMTLIGLPLASLFFQ